MADSFYDAFTPRRSRADQCGGNARARTAGLVTDLERTPADKAYVILEGIVSVRQHGEEIAQLGPGDIVGEAAIVNHSLRTASIVALTPLEMIHFTDGPCTLSDEMPSFHAALEAVALERFGTPT